MTFIKHTDFKDIQEYLDCYIWLTTERQCDIVNPKDKSVMLSGFSNPIAAFEYYIPNNISTKIETTYWSNYTWICKSFIAEDLFAHTKTEYHHFKMATNKELPYPPIPDFLVKLYKIST